jgi:hypothetical protein
MAWQVWLLFHVSSAEVSRVMWSCDDEGSCGTDDLAGGVPLMGLAAVVLLSFMAGRFLHRAVGVSPSPSPVPRSPWARQHVGMAGVGVAPVQVGVQGAGLQRVVAVVGVGAATDRDDVSA